MNKNRLQNHISGSVFTLPVCAFVACLAWWLPVLLPDSLPWAIPTAQVTDRSIAFVLAALITYVLIEMNNVNMLIRVRSRMVSSTWLLAATTIPVVHFYSDGLAAALCLAISYYLLFSTYQRKGCEVSTFHYALFLGLGSIFLPQLLVFLPFFLWHQTVFLRSTTLRTLCAALVGCLFPLLLWAAYWHVREDYAPLLRWFSVLTSYAPIEAASYLSLSLQQIASWGLLTLLAFIGVIHYLSTSYNDRIQVRMLLYIFVFQFFIVEIYVALQPQHLTTMLPILMVTSAPLTAHFFALTRSWFTNALFVLSLLSFLALGYLNLLFPWMPL